MSLLLGSTQADADRRDFLRTQILFWMLCAIDGHAKNFSLFLEAGGRYRLTPRYDVISAFPMLGQARGKLPPKKAKMAMAVAGTNRHYLWHSILRRHWEETARRCGVGRAMPSLIDELIERTPKVIDRVKARIPPGFPAAVAGPIFDGLQKSATKLAR
jgi:serine/threonine-protein kinase HipA